MKRWALTLAVYPVLSAAFSAFGREGILTPQTTIDVPVALLGLTTIAARLVLLFVVLPGVAGWIVLRASQSRSMSR